MKNFSLPVKQLRNIFLNLFASLNPPTPPKTPGTAGELRIIQIKPKRVKAYFEYGAITSFAPTQLTTTTAQYHDDASLAADQKPFHHRPPH